MFPTAFILKLVHYHTEMKIVLASILLVAITAAVSQPVKTTNRGKETFLKPQNMTKPHVPEHGSVIGKAEGCNYVKCGEAIISCAEKCGKDLASLDCVECLGPLYESCKTCF